MRLPRFFYYKYQKSCHFFHCVDLIVPHLLCRTDPDFLNMFILSGDPKLLGEAFSDVMFGPPVFEILTSLCLGWGSINCYIGQRKFLNRNCALFLPGFIPLFGNL